MAANPWNFSGRGQATALPRSNATNRRLVAADPLQDERSVTRYHGDDGYWFGFADGKELERAQQRFRGATMEIVQIHHVGKTAYINERIVFPDGNVEFDSLYWLTAEYHDGLWQYWDSINDFHPDGIP